MQLNTVDEVKAYLSKNARNGVECPCCHQLVKAYERKLNQGMVLFLIALFRMTQEGTRSVFHAEEILERVGTYTKSRDYSVLKHWGLIEEVEVQTDSSKRKAGYWQLTTAGSQFVRGIIPVASHVKIYNNKFYGVTGKFIKIREALGEKFNYDELMNA